MATETKLVTYDDYRNLPNDGKRYEIIRGELLMTPAPTTIHQRILRKLLILLNSYAEEYKVGEVLCAPVDVVLSMTDVVQPDLVFISKEREAIITRNNIVEAPDLVVEIVSEHTETIDRNRKKTLYERYRVQEYWIVDPTEKQIEQYVLEGEAFKLQAKIDALGELTSKVISDLILQLKDIFED